MDAATKTQIIAQHHKLLDKLSEILILLAEVQQIIDSGDHSGQNFIRLSALKAQKSSTITQLVALDEHVAALNRSH